MAAAPGQAATAGAMTGSSIPCLNAQLPCYFPDFWCSTLSSHFLYRNKPCEAFEVLIRALAGSLMLQQADLSLSALHAAMTIQDVAPSQWQ